MCELLHIRACQVAALIDPAAANSAAPRYDQSKSLSISVAVRRGDCVPVACFDWRTPRPARAVVGDQPGFLMFVR